MSECTGKIFTAFTRIRYPIESNAVVWNARRKKQNEANARRQFERRKNKSVRKKIELLS